jgi:hypothetical protein
VAAIFVPDGDTLVPTALARGPWDLTAMHGGPPSALLARAVEQAEPPEGVVMAVARITVELLRPIPIEPLVVRCEVVRPGRKVQLVEAAILHAASGTEVARARALRIREAPVALPYEDPVRGPLLVPEAPPAGPETAGPGMSLLETDVAFHQDGIELRFVEGDWTEPGPVGFWGRLRAPLVAGEEPTPIQRTVALSDMGNGVSGIVGFDTHMFINPELSVHVWRLPVGEWIGMRSRSDLGPRGLGMAESSLYDLDGRFGRAVQSLFVDAR